MKITQAPQDPSCVDFHYPDTNATEDVQMLCKMMPNMPACALYRECQASQTSSLYCRPMSLLTEICVVDNMKGMGSCKTFNGICAEGSLVSDCKSDNTTLLAIPTSKVIHLIISGHLHHMCKEYDHV